MRLEDLTPGLSLVGLEPTAVATLVAVVPIADGTVHLIYKTPDGTLRDRLLGRRDEAECAPATGPASVGPAAGWGIPAQ
jgi:hypothetical protein